MASNEYTNMRFHLAPSNTFKIEEGIKVRYLNYQLILRSIITKYSSATKASEYVHVQISLLTLLRLSFDIL